MWCTQPLPCICIFAYSHPSLSPLLGSLSLLLPSLLPPGAGAAATTAATASAGWWQSGALVRGGWVSLSGGWPLGSPTVTRLQAGRRRLPRSRIAPPSSTTATNQTLHTSPSPTPYSPIRPPPMEDKWGTWETSPTTSASTGTTVVLPPHSTGSSSGANGSRRWRW